MVCTIHILMLHRQRERSRLILWHMKEGRWPFGFDYRWAGLSVFARKKTVSAKTSRLKLQRAGPASRAVNERTDHCWFWTSRLCFVFALHKNTIVCHRYIIAAAFALHQNMIWCNSSSDTVVAESWLAAQPRWCWLNYERHLQPSMTTTTSGN